MKQSTNLSRASHQITKHSTAAKLSHHHPTLIGNRHTRNISQALPAWDGDLRLPEGLTFAEIKDKHNNIQSNSTKKEKKVTLAIAKSKEDQLNKFIQKNLAML